MSSVLTLQVIELETIDDVRHSAGSQYGCFVASRLSAIC